MMDAMINEFSAQIQDLQEAIKLLKEENRDLRDRLETSEQKSKLFVQRAEEYLNKWLEDKGRTQLDVCSCSNQGELLLSKETTIYEKVLGSILAKLGMVENLKDEKGKMSQQIYDYELHVEQLKDELREVRLKSKEEAEDLTQEMAELRYQTTSMLEGECRRRAHIEQASLQRISELEVEVQKEQKKSFLAAKRLFEVQKLAESRSVEIQHLRNLLEGSCTSAQRNQVQTSRECLIITDHFSEEPSEIGDKLGQLSIACFPEERHLIEELNHEDSSD